MFSNTKSKKIQGKRGIKITPEASNSNIKLYFQGIINRCLKITKKMNVAHNNYLITSGRQFCFKLPKESSSLLIIICLLFKNAQTKIVYFN